MSAGAASTNGDAGAGFARGALHAVAGIGALLVTLAFIFWIGGVDLAGSGTMLLATIAASQIAAMLGWRLIGRWPGSDWFVPLVAGFVMTLIVHAAAGILWALTSAAVMLMAGKSMPDLESLLEMAFFAVFYSVLFVGWVTAPVAMTAAVVVNRLHRKERRAGGPA